MIIQWFPGHMNKALKMMEQEVKIVDVIIYVLDSRAPFSCVNPKFTKIIGNKPIIYILNKCDMADEAKLKLWKEYFTQENSICLTMNSTASSSTKALENAILTLLKSRFGKYDSKGISLIKRGMILGVPNSGKSTLANNLCGKSKAQTGNKPGVTKSKQWVKIGNNIEVLDTPGTLWPAFDNNQIAKHLAYIGSIKEEVLDIPELSLDLIKDLNAIDKNILQERFNIVIEPDDEPLTILEKICESRKYMLKKGEIDYDRGAYALVNEFKSGKLGKITLETPKDIKRLTIKDRKKAIQQKEE